MNATRKLLYPALHVVGRIAKDIRIVLIPRKKTVFPKILIVLSDDKR